MHSHGIIGSSGHGVVVTDPDQKIKNRVADAVEGAFHRPAEGNQGIGNVVVSPANGGRISVFLATSSDSPGSFLGSEHEQARAYALELCKVDRSNGQLTTGPKLAVDNA